jgi:hypothetical protein
MDMPYAWRSVRQAQPFAMIRLFGPNFLQNARGVSTRKSQPFHTSRLTPLQLRIALQCCVESPDEASPHPPKKDESARDLRARVAPHPPNPLSPA